MKKKPFLIMLLASFALLPLSAQEKARVALDDIVVQSAQPQFKFIGKGITELIAVELVKSQAVVLVDREKRMKLLEEMEFGFSDAADPAKAAQLGRLLQAEYLGFGEAIDMGGKFVFSLKLVKVETGDVVWAHKVSESLGNYDYVASLFASSLLKAIKAPVAATTTAKVERKVEKNEQALVSFSKAVEAVDKKDTAKAKTELQTAQKYDPTSDAVAAYLAKLVTNTTKFIVLLDPFYPGVNPAYLGIIRTDMSYVSMCYPNIAYYGTLMPAVEQFFTDWFSARAGLEGSMLTGTAPTFGLGGLGGVTFRIPDWGMDIDINVTYRQRPSNMVSGVLYPDLLVLLNLSGNGVFVKSRG